MSPQTYVNTTIELDEADPSWGSTATSSQPGLGVYGDDEIDWSNMGATAVQGLQSSEDLRGPTVIGETAGIAITGKVMIRMMIGLTPVQRPGLAIMDSLENH